MWYQPKLLVVGSIRRCAFGQSDDDSVERLMVFSVSLLLFGGIAFPTLNRTFYRETFFL
jgi:hypothetical protein